MITKQRKCDARCWFAKSSDCSCQCGGEQHGTYYKETPEAKEIISDGIFGDWESRSVYIDGYKLSPVDSQKLDNHSPDGFMWGYGGSGPSQLALALLYYFTGRKDYSLRKHQDLKWDVIAKLDQKSFNIPKAAVTDWIKSHEFVN